MITADKMHKERVIEILSDCFDTNKTVNYIVKQDENRKERIRDLIDYSFESCVEAGQVLMTDDLSGVVICNMSDNKLPILEEAYLTLQFVFKVSGVDGLPRVLHREKYVNAHHPQEEEYIYIWFIGVEKGKQGRGIGSEMLQYVIDESNKAQIPIYIETSVERNLKFYLKHGFELYHTADESVFGYQLYFLRRFPDKSEEQPAPYFYDPV